MSITKTIGGERLGSGNKMRTELHGYDRSTHDLSTTWRSSMQVGVLTPCLFMQAEPDQTFEIAISHKILTEATNGPTFGIFDFRIDVFEAAIRLYNGLLHNNMVQVGLDMDSIKWPMLKLRTTFLPETYCEENGIDFNTHQISSSSLLNYLGISGVAATENWKKGIVDTEYNALGMFMYYDIFKNYKANKQEERAYVIAPNPRNMATAVELNFLCNRPIQKGTKQYNRFGNTNDADFIGGIEISDGLVSPFFSTSAIAPGNPSESEWIIIRNKDENLLPIIDVNNDNWINEITVRVGTTTATKTYTTKLGELATQAFVTNNQDVAFKTSGGTILRLLGITSTTTASAIELDQFKYNKGYYNQAGQTELLQFELKNIDKARQILLQQQQGTTLYLQDDPTNQFYQMYPYYANVATYTNNSINSIAMHAMTELCGLCVATYNSDLFNNWLNGEWINGTNGITAITNIDVSEGYLNLDILNIAQKTYNVLNRIIVSGATYEDWQEAVYGVKAIRRPESPVYQGGQSSKIIFDEVIATGGSEPLGTMGAHGINVNNSPGKLYIKCEEPAMIMAIASIIPNIDYSQGNYWFNKLTSLDEMHKPGYDRIGYQNLPTWQMAWWDGQVKPATSGSWTEFSAGKQPSWIQYQTNINTCHGRFAKENDMMFMTLNRNYKPVGSQGVTVAQSQIGDLTTYIDPTKYNYIFAQTTLDAQNFWVQIHFDIKTRWIGSANQIPNL